MTTTPLLDHLRTTLNRRLDQERATRPFHETVHHTLNDLNMTIDYPGGHDTHTNELFHHITNDPIYDTEYHQNQHTIHALLGTHGTGDDTITSPILGTIH